MIAGLIVCPAGVGPGVATGDGTADATVLFVTAGVVDFFAAAAAKLIGVFDAATVDLLILDQNSCSQSRLKLYC